VGTSPPQLSDTDRATGGGSEKDTRMTPRRSGEWEHCKRGDQTRRLREIVIRLAYSLTKEGGGCRRPSIYHDPWSLDGLTAMGSDRAPQLEVLEQHVSVVAANREEGRTSDAHRAGIVGPDSQVDQGSRHIPSRMPRRRFEDIERDDQVGVPEGLQHRCQRLRSIPDVLVGNDNRFGARDAHARRHAVYFAVRPPLIRMVAHMTNGLEGSCVVSQDSPIHRTVGHDHVSSHRLQIHGEFVMRTVRILAP
jgi:hypothetical protein